MHYITLICLAYALFCTPESTRAQIAYFHLLLPAIQKQTIRGEEAEEASLTGRLDIVKGGKSVLRQHKLLQEL